MRIAAIVLLCLCIPASAQQGLRGILKAPPAGGGGSGPTCTNIQCSLLNITATSGDLSSYAITGLSPKTNALILAIVENADGASAPDVPTMTGNNLTWINRASTVFATIGAPFYRATVFQAMGNPTSGTATIDFAGEFQWGILAAVFQFEYVPTGASGSNAIVNVTTLVSNSTDTIVMPTSSGADNNAGIVLGGGSGKVTPTASLWSRMLDYDVLWPQGSGIFGMLKIQGVPSPSQTFSVRADSYIGAIFVEIASNCP